MKEITTFFNEISTHNNDVSHKDFQNFMFILVNEFHWTQKEIEEAELPFVWDLIEARFRMIKEQEKLMKKRR